jgi:hypothetical protein
MNRNKFITSIRRIPNLLRGYNIYVNPEKLYLIDRVFNVINNNEYSFIDLGGAWNVNGAYSKYTLLNHQVVNSYLIDTNINYKTKTSLGKFEKVKIINDDFGNNQLIDKIENVEVIYQRDISHLHFLFYLLIGYYQNHH